MQMVAKKLCRPGGSGTRQLQPGETFEATPQMAKLAKAFGWADPAPEPAPDLAPEPVQEEAEEVEEKTTEQDQPEPIMNAASRKTAKKAAKKVPVEKPAKRTYNTRRMTAKR